MDASRRQFLRDSLALAAGGSVLACSAESPSTTNVRATGDRSLVARAHQPNVRTGPDRFDPMALDTMLGECLKRVTNTADSAAAWKSLFSPKDRVALKINTLGGKGLSTQPAVVEAIVRGLLGAGVPEGNILVWDRFNRELIRAGYTINRNGKGWRCFGTESDYEGQMTVSGKIGGFLSTLLTQFPTALINVPVLKDHNLAGVAVSMKNLYGCIDNPNRYHDNNCDPYIADLAALPVVRQKMRLIVCDALYAQYEAGPAYHPKFRWEADTLLVSVDPVALDTIGWQMIEAKRKEAGLKPLSETGRPPRWLATAAARGLGQNDPAKIEVADV
ncbi:MAG: DUF362 domain-containing protein [Candidatus Sumerlaeia bacterium]|nr:DUF362 domain-containing protein [Candidatus Sumerlaeia bacterium]